MLGLGESLAAELMKHMEPPEVERVGRAMASLSGVSDEQIAHVLSSFHEELSQINPIGVGASSFTERVMLEALGEEKARNVLFKVMPGDKPTQAIEALRWMPAVTVADIFKQEHPQIGATILSLLDDTQSGEILPMLDKDTARGGHGAHRAPADSGSGGDGRAGPGARAAHRCGQKYPPRELRVPRVPRIF